mmetsp:Transcript_17901/g.30889  ORF Transcript_17901/g.30889 Transcript_17901/m.30889 type:complete len:170 (+) Transcript_17901:151-660(+)
MMHHKILLTQVLINPRKSITVPPNRLWYNPHILRVKSTSTASGAVAFHLSRGAKPPSIDLTDMLCLSPGFRIIAFFFARVLRFKPTLCPHRTSQLRPSLPAWDLAVRTATHWMFLEIACRLRLLSPASWVFRCSTHKSVLFSALQARLRMDFSYDKIQLFVRNYLFDDR